ncbi:MAG: CDP-alcohol phosphatidyltransferase family protein [Pseudomonadota bacterium]
MTLSARRERFSCCSATMGALLSRLPLSANAWTTIGLAAGGAAAALLATGRLTGGGLVFAFSGLCDLADGAVARRRGSASRRGAYFDTLADRFVEAAAVLGLLPLALPPLVVSARYWLFSYMFLSLMVTYAKAAAVEKKLSANELRGGILEKPERCIILSLGLIAGGRDRRALTWTLALLTTLAAVSLGQRIHRALVEERR